MPRGAAVGLGTLMVALSACAETPRLPGAAPEAPPAAETSPAPSTAPRPARVDPRRGGFEVGLGEWAVALEAPAIRPGPVTFVVRNGGAMVHGFEMEIEGRDSSGPGSGEGFKFESSTLRPGEAVRFELRLAPGVYEVECLVDGHDDRGMETVLEVRRDAPLVRAASEVSNGVRIAGFAFAPETLELAAGGEAAWTNEDPEPHTVTARDGTFDSGPIQPGAGFRHAFDSPGRFEYFCAIHPSMEGSVIVG